MKRIAVALLGLIGQPTHPGTCAPYHNEPSNNWKNGKRYAGAQNGKGKSGAAQLKREAKKRANIRKRSKK